MFTTSFDLRDQLAQFGLTQRLKRRINRQAQSTKRLFHLSNSFRLWFAILRHLLTGNRRERKTLSHREMPVAAVIADCCTSKSSDIALFVPVVPDR
jgi:hypothetical protein